MEKLLPLIIQIIGGAAGGNVIGALLKNVNLDKIVATIIGGIAGGQLADLTGLLEQVIGSAGGGAEMAGQGGASAIGGAVLTAIVGLIKKAMAKP
jgi:hypothetical protein